MTRRRSALLRLKAWSPKPSSLLWARLSRVPPRRKFQCCALSDMISSLSLLLPAFNLFLLICFLIFGTLSFPPLYSEYTFLFYLCHSLSVSLPYESLSFYFFFCPWFALGVFPLCASPAIKLDSGHVM